MKSRGHKTLFIIISIFLMALVVVLALFSQRLYNENKKLEAQLQEKEREFNTKAQQVSKQAAVFNSFLDSRISKSDGSEIFSNARATLISEKKDFVEVNLKTMKLTLFREGLREKTFDVLSKGRDGSWWETPSGYYLALNKEVKHFSSIGKVWQPWSIQFYGNFFIHGWPYHDDGTPVPKSYSGGCVRLRTEDSKEVFDFIKKGMPIVLLDEEVFATSTSIFNFSSQDVSPIPEISAKAALIADLDTSEIIANKNADEVFPIASITKLMTATVASELIYLERSITVKSEMMRDTVQAYPLQIGARYRAFDLFYPLLMQSSNGAARVIAGFLGEKYFVQQMNEKSKTLNMENTMFIDPAGIDGGNASTLKDLAKLAKYILEKRDFIFNITRGKDYDIFGTNVFSNISNHNEFYSEKNLIGVKNGKTEIARDTLITVWNFKDSFGSEHRIMIGILGSENRAKDMKVLRDWMTANFKLSDSI